MTFCIKSATTLVSLLFLLFLASCSSNKLTVTSEERKDLVDDFQLNDEMAKKLGADPVPVEDIPSFENKNRLKKRPVSELGDQASPTPPKIIDEPAKVSPLPLRQLSYNWGIPKNYPKDYPQFLKDRDKESVWVWGQYRSNVYKGEKNIFEVKYFGVVCGTIETRSLGLVKIGKKYAYHFYARGKSADFYEMFYKLDDYVESFVDAKDFTPIKYTLVQRESSQKVDDLQLFDVDKLQTHMWFKRIKKDSETKNDEMNFIPRLAIDSFSALYFVRGLPMKIGAKFSIPVITRTKTWILGMEVVGRETLELKEGIFKALKVRAETHFPGVLKKRGDIYFWFSDDEKLLPLKFEGKVKIGSVEGVLIEHKEGDLIEYTP